MCQSSLLVEHWGQGTICNAEGMKLLLRVLDQMDHCLLPEGWTPRDCVQDEKEPWFACLSLGPGWISSENTSPVELSWWGRGCWADFQLPQLRPWVTKDPKNQKESIVEMTAIVAGLPMSFLKSTTISIVFRLSGLSCLWKLKFSLITPCYTTA